MNSLRFLPLLSSAVWCAANALAATVIRPVGVTLTGADEFFPASNLIDGSGLEFQLDTGDSLPATWNHWWADPTRDSWVSSDPGGLLSDWYANSTTVPTLVLDLGQDTALHAVHLWAYSCTAGWDGTFQGNSARTLEFRFNTAAQGNVTFGGPAVSVTMDHGPINETPPGFVVPRQDFDVGSQTARWVEMRITDNWFVAPGDGTGTDEHGHRVRGGDRVGLGEVRFSRTTEPAGAKRWEFQTGGAVGSSPAIGADGTVYVGSHDHKVYALDGETGAKRWEFATGGEVFSSPAIGADGTVYVGSYDHKVYALDGMAGGRRWEFATGNQVHGSPALGADGTVFVGSYDHKVYALNGATGARRWEYETGGYVSSSPAIGADGTVYVECLDGRIYALNGATGQKAWEFQTDFMVGSSPAIGADNSVYAGSAWRVYALNGATGLKRWEYSGGLSHSSPAVGADGTVYVGCTNELRQLTLTALNGATGEKRWEFLMSGPVESCPAVGADGTVYVGAWDQKVHALDGATGQKRWEFATAGAVVSSPAIGADGTVYVGSGDGKVYALSSSSVGGLATSPWPKFHRDAQNTGRVAGAEPAKAPRLTAEPEDVTAVVGANVAFAVRASGTPPLAYQWRKDGSALVGSTEASLVLNNVRLDQAGGYAVVITNALGAVTSRVATLTVRLPDDVVVWSVNGHGYRRVDEPGITWSAARLAAVAAVHEGMTGHLVTVSSAEENRFLTEHPELGDGGANRLNRYWLGAYQPAGTGEPLDGWTWVTGEPWDFMNWSPLEPNDAWPGEDHAMFNHLFNSEGKQWNDAPENYAAAEGYVIEFEPGASPPNIVAQPQDRTALVGATVVMEVTTQGQSPLHHQWQKDGSVLVEGGRLSGVTTARLNLANVVVADAGLYSVVVTNPFGAVTSRTARLTVTPPIHYLTNLVWVETLAGSGVAGYADGIGTQARFNHPNAGAVDPAGFVCIADTDGHRVRKISPTGEVRTLAGTGVAGHADGPGDVAQFNEPLGLCVDTAGTVYVVEAANHCVRKITTDGQVTTLAGNRTAGHRDGPGTQAQFNLPNDVTLDAAGNLYVTEFDNHTVRRITPDGAVSTWVGSRTAGYQDGPRAQARLTQPAGIACDAAGNLYITEWGGQRVRKVSPDGVVSTVAGTGETGYQDGLASEARFNQPDGIAVDALGNLWITDAGNHAIRRITVAGVVETVAGTGTAGYVDGEGQRARFALPAGIGRGGDDTFYVADWWNHVVRRVTLPRPADVTPPTLVSISGDNTLTRATLRFSEALGVLSATNTANYAFSAGVQVLRATLETDGATVVLDTTPQSPGTAYTLTVSNLNDLAGNVIAPGSQRSFTSGAAAGLGQFLFANRIPLATPPIDSRVLDPSGTPLSGTAYFAQAYVKLATDPNPNFLPVGSPVNFRTGNNAGYIVPVVVTTPFPAGTTIVVEMRVWEAARGGTYEEALANGGLSGRSNPVSLTATAAPDPPAEMVGMQSWHLLGPPPMPPWITRQPTGLRVPVGSAFFLSVSATNAAPRAYQWFHDGQSLPGQNESLLNVPSPQLDDAGGYHVTVTNSVGSATSELAHVVVGYPLLLVTNGPGRIEVKPAFWIQEPGQQVVLTAIPEKGHAFQGWQGDLAGTINPATLVMDGTKQVHAWFQRDTSRLKWQVATGGALLSCPAIGRDGTVYVPAGRTVLALDGASGATKWSVPLDCLPHESLALGADGTVYVGSWDRQVYALDAASGAQKWAYQTINTVETSPAVRADGTVIVGCSNLLGQATITALDGGQGTRRWEYVTGTPGRASLSLGAQGTVYVGAGTNLFALDGQPGTGLWVAGGPNYLADAPAIGADGTIYVKAWDGRLYARDGSTGAPRWASGLLGVGPGGPAIGFEGTIYLGASRTLFALNATNGGVRWQFAADGSVEGTPAVAADNTICVMSTSGTLYALDGATGAEKWRFITGSRLWGSPAIGGDGTVYVGADDGTLYAVQGSRGLAATAWPKFHRDAQNTGQAPAEPPALLPQPSRAVLTEGAEDRITVRFSGIPAPQLQWYFNGATVPGGTNEPLAFPSVTRAIEGLYWAAASNWLGQATSAPVVAVVSNVDPGYYPAWRWEGGGGAVQVLGSPSIFGPWTPLFTPPAGATSGYYIETNLQSPSLYYQLREEGGEATARFTATAHVPGWRYEGAVGTRHRIEYVWEGSGWANWVGLTELTLPESPHLFLDTDAFDHPRAVYRTTPVP